MVGPMSLQFPKQLRAAGNRKPIVGGGTSYDEFALPFMSDEVIGDVSALQYSAALATPANEAFVKKYRAKYDKVPSYYSEANYAAAQWIDLTLARHKGQYPGPVEFIKTMATIEIDAPRGPVRLDLSTKSPIQNIYIKKVEKKNVRLRQGRAVEYGDQDVSGGRHVLDLRQGQVFGAAGVQPGFPALQVLRVAAISLDLIQPRHPEAAERSEALEGRRPRSRRLRACCTSSADHPSRLARCARSRLRMMGLDQLERNRR